MKIGILYLTPVILLLLLKIKATFLKSQLLPVTKTILLLIPSSLPRVTLDIFVISSDFPLEDKHGGKDFSIRLSLFPPSAIAINSQNV